MLLHARVVKMGNKLGTGFRSYVIFRISRRNTVLPFQMPDQPFLQYEIHYQIATIQVSVLQNYLLQHRLFLSR
jgi:hypothetical protein